MEHFRTGFVVFGLVLCMILKSVSQEIRVDGDDFVAYNLSSIPWLSRIKRHSLMLDFKTVHPSGLLVYIGSEPEPADFLMLDLVRGKLRYEAYFVFTFVYLRINKKKTCNLLLAKSIFHDLSNQLKGILNITEKP